MPNRHAGQAVEELSRNKRVIEITQGLSKVLASRKIRAVISGKWEEPKVIPGIRKPAIASFEFNSGTYSLFLMSGKSASSSMIKYKQEGRGAELHLDYHLSLNQRRQVIFATALEAEMVQNNYPDSAKVIRDTAKKIAGVK